MVPNLQTPRASYLNAALTELPQQWNDQHTVPVAMYMMKPKEHHPIIPPQPSNEMLQLTL